MLTCTEGVFSPTCRTTGNKFSVTPSSEGRFVYFFILVTTLSCFRDDILTRPGPASPPLRQTFI